MLRVRLDGGALSLAQLRVLADISSDFARGTADISDRQNIQYHWIRVEDVPEIWRRLEAVGLQTTEACGDTPRVVLGSPLAGIAADEILDPTPTIDEITRRFVGDPELANLPRKFKSAVTGHPSLDVVHEINDISLVGVVHPELGAGYDLWVGGGLSTAPRLGRAARRVRRPGRGGRRLARRHLDLPRLRLPPAAHQGPPEVPHGRVGARAVPRGAREGVPRARAARRAAPGSPVRPRRPRRRAPPEGRQQLRRRRSRRRPDQRRRAHRSRRPAWRPPAPTGCASPRTRSSSSSTSAAPPSTTSSPGSSASGCRCRPSPFRAAHDGVHRHRVLQARDRRDQGHRGHRHRRARAPARRRHRRHRHPGHPQRQRLPELLRPHPGRRHRAQGDDRHDRRRAGAGLPGAPRRRARLRRPRRGRPRPHRARPEGHRRRPARPTSSASCAAGSTSAGPARRSPAGPTASTRRS